MSRLEECPQGILPVCGECLVWFVWIICQQDMLAKMFSAGEEESA